MPSEFVRRGVVVRKDLFRARALEHIRNLNKTLDTNSERSVALKLRRLIGAYPGQKQPLIEVGAPARLANLSFSIRSNVANLGLG